MSATQDGAVDTACGGRKDAVSRRRTTDLTAVGPGADAGAGDIRQAIWNLLHPMGRQLQQLGERIREQPLRAVLIAAGTGYLLRRLVR